MSASINREYQLSQLISNRNEQYQRDQELKERLERERRAAMTEERARSLERQINEKQLKQQFVQDKQQLEVVERYKMEADY